jgi:hypothetical protein
VSVRRGLLLAAGLAALGFGVLQLVTGVRTASLVSTGIWFVAVLVVHDGVVAPLAVGAGALLRRLPGIRGALPVVAGALLVAATVTIVAVVSILAPGTPGNPTVLPRDYGRGLALLLIADLAGTAVAVVLIRRPRRGGGRRGT